ncbi:DUF3375 family protein [Leptospira alstonii]|uniref:PF11855 family protein n=2 Tax=Leptospira alstonii TaxID=28452 RepID=M6CX66_9LEPT|nr:DUF3375 family protein [Leptospira alstonii]EMJ93538.1 PF11855 family protein [Leptospira alstonii serovar Sichuan str. 79601]EQA81723.1 PF11855 family protein [Leptospira alstonii serovar Pingchang str. 80-412]
MEYSKIKYLLKSSAIRILRKDFAGVIVSFLYDQFKTGNRFWIPTTEMSLNLRNFLEDLKDEGDVDPSDFARSSDVYINEWVNEGFLTNRVQIVDGSEEIILELTPEMEKLFSWLEDLRDLESNEIVGTESRFFSILNKLKEIVEETVSGPEEKIRQLEKKKEELDLEIAQIRKSGRVDVFPSERIQSQFLYAKKEALSLLGDFKQVESNFHDMTQSIHRKYLEIAEKGDILEFVLGEDTELLNSAQGRSFQTFWEFLRSEKHQDFLEKLIQTLYSMPDVLTADPEYFFKKLRKNLREAGARVNTVVSQMSEQLKKTLVDQTILGNRKVKELINEIKNSVLNSDLSSDFAFHDFEEPDVRLTMERPIWKGDDFDSSRTVFVEEQQESFFDWETLYPMIRGIDPEILEGNIRSLLRYKPEIGLEEVLRQYPDQTSLEEIVIYLWIASVRETYSIDARDFFRWIRDKEIVYRIPKVIYRVREDG